MFRFLTPLVGIIIAIVLVVTIAVPSFERIQATDQDLREYEQANRSADLLRQRVDELIMQRAELSPGDIERLEAFVPETINTIDVLRLLDSVAARNQMEVRNISISRTDALDDSSGSSVRESGEDEDTADAAGREHITRVAISFSVLGMYEELRTFIEELEESLVLMDIASLSIQAESSGEDSVYGVTVHLYEFTYQDSI